MDKEPMRADAALVARGLAASREKARGLIEAGLVTLNGRPVAKPATKVCEADVLAVTGELHPYVSRGGLKLEKALRVFQIDPAGQVCLDVGASTGGFTDVLLRGGARHVYAVDVGQGQLDPVLAHDPRVTSMERVNARTLAASMFPLAPTLAVMDVSFISIRLILPALTALLGGNGRLACLVKPQFEAGREHIGKRGIVSSPEVHRQVLTDIADFAATLGWGVRGMDFSPIFGGDGNMEFLADMAPLARCERVVGPEDIAALVRRAHQAF